MAYFLSFEKKIICIKTNMYVGSIMSVNITSAHKLWTVLKLH